MNELCLKKGGKTLVGKEVNTEWSTPTFGTMKIFSDCFHHLPHNTECLWCYATFPGENFTSSITKNKQLQTYMHVVISVVCDDDNNKYTTTTAKNVYIREKILAADYFFNNLPGFVK